MVNKRAKNTSETKNLLVELEEKAKRVEEVTGERIDNRHMMSVLMGILDTETMKHTAQFQGSKVKAETLKRKVLEFVNLMGTGRSGPDAMDIGRFERANWSDLTEEEEQEEEVEPGNLNRFGEVCYNCGGKGHYARDCRWPRAKGESKGEQKGKGKGENKGKGKGKGDQKGRGKGDWGPKSKGAKGASRGPQYGGCWECGGPHFSRDCPGGKGGAGGGNVKSLCSVRYVKEQRQQTFYPRFEVNKIEERTKKDIEAEHEEKVFDNPPAPVGPPRHAKPPRAFVFRPCSKYLGCSCEKEFKDEDYTEIEDPEVLEKSTHKEQLEKDEFVLVKSKNKKKLEKAKSLITIMPEGVMSVDEIREWEEIDMAVDSGATESVIGEEMLMNVEMKEGEATRRGVQYEVASGSLIPNLGEKKFMAVDEQGVERRMTVQVCDVNKPLLSVHKIVQAGNEVVFSRHGSYVKHEATGEKMHLRETGGMYMLKLWARKSFQGQGSNP